MCFMKPQSIGLNIEGINPKTIKDHEEKPVVCI